MKKLFFIFAVIFSFSNLGVADQALSPTPISQPIKKKIPYSSLTSEQKEILDRGEITTGPYVAGGVLGTFPGLGIGHAIQGRYAEKGWIFTVGELGSVVVLGIGVGTCVGDTLSGTNPCTGGAAAEIIAGYIAYVGFRIWEIIDVWAAPPELNRRYHHLKGRVEGESDESHFNFMFLPVTADNWEAGVRYSF